MNTKLAAIGNINLQIDTVSKELPSTDGIAMMSKYYKRKLHNITNHKKSDIILKSIRMFCYSVTPTSRATLSNDVSDLIP